MRLVHTRKMCKQPCCGSPRYSLACLLQHHSASSSVFCGFLNLNSRCNPNPRESNKNLRGDEADRNQKDVQIAMQSCISLSRPFVSAELLELLALGCSEP